MLASSRCRSTDSFISPARLAIIFNRSIYTGAQSWLRFSLKYWIAASVSGEIHSNGHNRIDSLLLPRHGDVTDGLESLEPLGDFVDMLLRQSQLAALVTPAKPPTRLGFQCRGVARELVRGGLGLLEKLRGFGRKRPLFRLDCTSAWLNGRRSGKQRPARHRGGCNRHVTFRKFLSFMFILSLK